MDGFCICPFCGEQPEVQTLGTCISIECCCFMEFQKSDYLSMPERETWNTETHVFSDKVEKKVLGIAQKYWNTRS